MGSLKAGDLIVDNLGGKGVVAERALKPAATWLKAQDDKRMRTARGPWWEVFPLDGGCILVPESLARRLRRATVDDVVALMNSDESDNGAAMLRHLFASIRAGSGGRRPKRPRQR